LILAKRLSQRHQKTKAKAKGKIRGKEIKQNVTTSYEIRAPIS
jgi:hypothetical protein